jgi:hypothetical protein
MESILAEAMDEELAIAIVMSALVFVGLCFVIVLAVRSVPNKLLLLGLLMAVTAVTFAAIVPGAGKLVLALLVPAIALILAGALCLGIGYLAQLFRTDKEDRK